jgi:CxxC-x17-CxxC domain-containing protein
VVRFVATEPRASIAWPAGDPFLLEGPSAMPADATLICRDCGQRVTFSSGEQDFYAGRGFSEPGRCPDCRAAGKAERDAGGGASAGDSGGGRGPRPMYAATCANRGKEAQVPFRPSSDKPVYCSACFQQRGGRSGGRGRY